MINVYIVVEGGCVRYVSADTDTPVAVDVIDLDDRRDTQHPEDRANYDLRLKEAESLVRVW